MAGSEQEEMAKELQEAKLLVRWVLHPLKRRAESVRNLVPPNTPTAPAVPESVHK